jgi:hypothetical protein
MKVFNDLKTRGVADILIAVTDGLKGMAEALEAVFPVTTKANLSRASDPQQPGLRQLEGSQGAGGGHRADLHGPRRRTCERPSSMPLPKARAFVFVLFFWIAAPPSESCNDLNPIPGASAAQPVSQQPQPFMQRVPARGRRTRAG